MLKSVLKYLDSRLETAGICDSGLSRQTEETWIRTLEEEETVQSDRGKLTIQRNGRLQYRSESTLRVYEAK